ncbi:cytochrome c oxidase assembly factor 1 family protein [Bacillus subtilis subsp. subtilis]|nr:cytochrome c oxidase assembly factor 1 family protein [Bacillus subtilis subsp. subtilis]
MHQPPPLPGARPAGPGWWRRHWRWALPLTVLLTTAAAAGLIWFVLVQWSQFSRGSEPYQEAMRRARCSVDLVAHLGEPIQDGFLPMGGMESSSTGTGSSQFVVQLRGPHGKGRLFLQAQREQGQWDYPMLYVLVKDAEPIDLTALDDAEAAQECALEACRGQGDCPVSVVPLEV